MVLRQRNGLKSGRKLCLHCSKVSRVYAVICNFKASLERQFSLDEA